MRWARCILHTPPGPNRTPSFTALDEAQSLAKTSILFGPGKLTIRVSISHACTRPPAVTFAVGVARVSAIRAPIRYFFSIRRDGTYRIDCS